MGPFSFHTLVAQEGAVSNEATSIFRNSRQRTTRTAQTRTDTKRALLKVRRCVHRTVIRWENVLNCCPEKKRYCCPADGSRRLHVNQSSQDQLHQLNAWPSTLMTFNKNRTNTARPTRLKPHPISLASISLAECSLLGCSNQCARFKIGTPKHSLSYSLDVRSKHNAIAAGTLAS